MPLLIGVTIVVLAAAGALFWKEWRQFGNTQTELLYKIVALSDYRAWRARRMEELSGHFKDVEVHGLGLKYDQKTKDCLVARRYQHRLESPEGWETEVVWEIRDLRNGSKNADIFWGSALPGAVAGDGDRKKSPEQTERDQGQKDYAERLLRDFDFVWD